MVGLESVRILVSYSRWSNDLKDMDPSWTKSTSEWIDKLLNPFIFRHIYGAHDQTTLKQVISLSKAKVIGYKLQG